MGAGLALLGAVDPKAHRHATIASIGVPIEGEAVVIGIANSSDRDCDRRIWFVPE
jgi:hypothetical protein